VFGPIAGCRGLPPLAYRCHSRRHSGTLRLVIRLAIVVAVNGSLLTSVNRVQFESCGGGRSGTGTGSLRVLWFPLPSLISSTVLPHTR
jgi:hypothetical protein